jgi:WD repeat-containing protein 76
MSAFSDLSDYERLRLENIRRNDDFLGSLGLHEVKDTISHTIAATTRSTQRGAQRGVKRPAERALPERRSTRVTDSKLQDEIKQLEAAGQTDQAAAKKAEYDEIRQKKMEGSYEAVLQAMEEQRVSRLPSDPISLYSAANAPAAIEDRSERWGAEMWNTFARVCKTPLKSSKIIEDKEYAKSVASLSLSEEHCAKVVESRIVSVFLHPTSDKVICLAGDKQGCVGIWDVNFSQRKDIKSFDSRNVNIDGVYKFYPHVSNVTSLHTWSSSLEKVFSTSYDGTVRCLDLHSESFLQTFSLESDIYEPMISDAAYLRDEASILLGMSDGNVSLVDTRSSLKAWEKPFQLSKINSIQQNPVDENMVLTAGSGKGGQICLHDLRMVGKPKFTHLKAFDVHTKSINAAYITGDGEHIVSVSQDDYVFLWYGFMGSSAPKISRMKHNNQTGRWLSTFKPSFDPKNLNSFLLGSMDRPRRLEVFEVNTKTHTLEMLTTLMGDALGSVQSRNAFHPRLNVIAASNSSGRVSVFF